MTRNCSLFSTTIIGIIIVFYNFNNIDCYDTSLDFNLESLIPDDYNPNVRPLNPYGQNTTTNISLSLYMNLLKNVDNVDQHLEMDLIIIQEWYDTRINLDLIDDQVIISESSKIRMFWLPDTYIINALNARVVDSLIPAQKLIINSQGLMYFAIRVMARVKCSLNLQLYPMDYQYCHIRFSSILYNREQLMLTWKLFDIHKDEYPEFKIRLWFQYEICRPWQNPIRQNTCIVATMKLVRNLNYYIIRYYLLTFLTVVISFVGFWCQLNGWPARVTVMIIPLMDLITEDIDDNNDIQVNYVTAFHWWMMWIQGFVYLVVVEYAVAIAWAHFIVDKKNHRKKLQEYLAAQSQGIAWIGPPPPPVLLGYYCGNNGWYARAGRFVDRMIYFFVGEADLQRDPYVRNKIDYASRILFPLIFLLFVLIYILATVAPWAANYN